MRAWPICAPRSPAGVVMRGALAYPGGGGGPLVGSLASPFVGPWASKPLVRPPVSDNTLAIPAPMRAVPT